MIGLQFLKTGMLDIDLRLRKSWITGLVVWRSAGGWLDGEDPALVENRHAVGNGQREFAVVGDDDGRKR